MTTALAAPTAQTWSWQGFSIRYQFLGTTGTPVLCIHGFGASSDHWRQNLPAFGEQHRAYAIDCDRQIASKMSFWRCYPTNSGRP